MDGIARQALRALLRRRDSLRATNISCIEPHCAGPAPCACEPGCDREAQGELLRIEAALERMADGRFGLCSACGSAVGRQRLRAVPEADLCPSCSSRRPG
ncbi:MAG TPA: TraR/DksA C4-type zinc finger protein [Myxococcaceae bacterium]|nr:TraR/DksA C4-type zinc finger protein [Myxococcaceae bacterium]